MSDGRTSQFEANRAHLTGIAYRMLGEMAAAEDIVQDAWLRWRGAETKAIRDVRAWLSAVTMRLCLDALRSARARRERYVGPWLPEPLVPDDTRILAADTPAAHAELASDLSLALLHVLERLSPDERAALILHDAFDCDYARIAAMLGKSEPACRKLVSRARERVKADRPRNAVRPEDHRALVARFSAAAASFDAENIAALLAPDVVLYSDGGGRVPAALNPVHGADHVSRLVVGIARKFYAGVDARALGIEVNGEPGLALVAGNMLASVTTLDVDGDRVAAVFVMRNPDKLERIAAALGLRPPEW